MSLAICIDQQYLGKSGFLKEDLFIFGGAGFSLLRGSSRVVVSRGYSIVSGFSLWWLLLLGTMGSRAHGLQ